MNTEQQFRGLTDHLVARLVGEEHVAAWWTSPNQAFDGRTPESQWAQGSDAVVSYLVHHALAGGGS
jgi:hypothetical protein